MSLFDFTKTLMLIFVVSYISKTTTTTNSPQSTTESTTTTTTTTSSTTTTNSPQSTTESGYTTTHSPQSKAKSGCSLELAIQSGHIPFNESLKGVEIKVAMSDDGLPWSVYDSVSKTFTGGYSVDIVNELARSAGFIPNMSLFTKGKNETYTQVLQRLFKHNDICGSWFVDCAPRRVLDMNFLHHFVDSTVVLVIAKPEYKQDTFSLTAFLKPFTPQLWLLLVAGIVFNAICSFLFHVMGQPSKGRKCCTTDLLHEFGSYLYVSFGHFTASGDAFKPVGICSRINTLMWSFLVLIVLASYTANLATELINEGIIAPRLDTIDAIVLAGQPMCVCMDCNEGPKIKSKWPNMKVVDVGYVPSMNAQYLRDGTCVGALMGYTDATVLLPEHCDMELTTSRLFSGGGSFAIHTDEDRCGPTIQKLLNYHFVRMEENGILDELWSKQINSLECKYNVAERSESSDDTQLGLYDLGGLALIYGSGAAVLLGLNAIVFCCRRKKPKEIQTNQTEPAMTKSISLHV